MATAFFETYERLCAQRGMSDNAVAAEIGLSNSTVTSWKQGALPRRPTVKKVADYFGVTTDYLLSGGLTLGSELSKIIEEESQRLDVPIGELIHTFLERRSKDGKAITLNKENISKYFDSIYKNKKPTIQADGELNKDDEELIKLFRSAAPTKQAAILALLKE